MTKLEYENNDSTILAGVKFKASEAFEIGFDAVYTNSDGALEPFDFDVSESYLTGKVNQSYDFSEAYSYSDLDMKRLELALTLRYKVSELMAVWGGYRYVDFEDDAPYLYETTGSVDFYSLGLAWSF